MKLPPAEPDYGSPGPGLLLEAALQVPRQGVLPSLSYFNWRQCPGSNWGRSTNWMHHHPDSKAGTNPSLGPAVIIRSRLPLPKEVPFAATAAVIATSQTLSDSVRRFLKATYSGGKCSILRHRFPRWGPTNHFLSFVLHPRRSSG